MNNVLKRKLFLGGMFFWFLAPSILNFNIFILRLAVIRGKQMSIFRKYFGQPSAAEHAAGMRQLAVMLKSGVSLSKALSAMESSPNQHYAQVWSLVHDGVQHGRTLSESMMSAGNVFRMIDIGLVKSGEASCSLDTALSYLADILERELRMKRAMAGALQYPLLLLGLCFIILFGVVRYVFPIFFGIFSSCGELPAITRIFSGIVSLIVNPWFTAVVLIALSALIYLAARYWKTPQGRYHLQTEALKIPVVGSLVRSILLARFCFIMSVLLRSGMPIISCFEVASSSLANYPLSECLESVISDISDGNSVSSAMREEKFFPPLVAGMVSAAEESGELYDGLERLGRMYELKTQELLDQAAVLAEPILTCVIGIFVGAMVVAMFVPIYQFITAI